MRAIAVSLPPLLLAVLLTSACTPAHISSTWQELATAPHYPSVVVFGVADSALVRHAYEDNFVRALRQHGVTATPGHRLLAEADVAGGKALRAAIGRSSAAAVAVVHLRCDSPGDLGLNPFTHVRISKDGKLYPYYTRVHQTVTANDYYARARTLRLETSLYDAEDTTLAWSGRSAPLAPDSEQTTIGELIEAMVARMRQDGVITDDGGVEPATAGG
ncbi:hypothetical protein [Marichromatium bheemlicum]|uniref:DUF4136 domain-containing protein n=1 Tax=Marichromatium bheemlicum TaxID=365339 RepID=A0ABX1I4L7_9GAMM|nr:hypothetical protein [Marichromatium bheemlicum]NKN31834.1 hypothetical protein [Marichromatium bheemlicum]